MAHTSLTPLQILLQADTPCICLEAGWIRPIKSYLTILFDNRIQGIEEGITQ